jgi:hypothetical protein
MNIGFSLIIVLFVAIHGLLIIEVVFNLCKLAICVCGRRFNLPDVGKYICPSCGKTHLKGKE